MSERANDLIQKLERGLVKSKEFFNGLTHDQWNAPIFREPDSWRMRDLVAHFIATEEVLLEISKDIAAGGEGTPEGMELDTWNQEQIERMAEVDLPELLTRMDESRQTTIAWLEKQDDATLDLEGRHPTLGTSNVEIMIYSIYAHQLLHIKEIAPAFRSSS
jgi:hypothetical protein